jgi:hypothetical protein
VESGICDFAFTIWTLENEAIELLGMLIYIGLKMLSGKEVQVLP